ncbi:sensor histidine kinase [Pedobacter sp. MR2016-24]|uniref:sensor histidine kinase n=1 Tax=Pedobacter sp. MR2016-24 TaxID=2994466 RepID=UPI00224539B1|nr:HAMP domain-containing sensor histidine kinase [Pedobacter sp. MR2016-24]MCX2485307.1 HAMP domain-containing sensor histidine kinase [Pedobacter sp. MR2016-24]
MTNPLNKNIIKNADISALAANFREYIARNKAEEEREQLIEDLTSRNQDLSQFAYITSHNLRAPLSNLIGLIDILNYDLLDEYNKTIVDMFKDSALKLNETIYDLTQMLSIKSNKNISIENVSVARIFKKVCNSFTKQIHTMGISIHTDFQCEMIPFNKSYLESVLMNLMSNAVKYCSENRPLKIEVSTKLDRNGDIILTFSDNGMGIDLIKHKDRIFGLNERFHSHVNGSGVGLFITKTQINSLGGDITVKSEVDKGSTFTVTIKNPC